MHMVLCVRMFVLKICVDTSVCDTGRPCVCTCACEGARMFVSKKNVCQGVYVFNDVRMLKKRLCAKGVGV